MRAISFCLSFPRCDIFSLPICYGDITKESDPRFPKETQGRIIEALGTGQFCLPDAESSTTLDLPAKLRRQSLQVLVTGDCISDIFTVVRRDDFSVWRLPRHGRGRVQSRRPRHSSVGWNEPILNLVAALRKPRVKHHPLPVGRSDVWPDKQELIQILPKNGARKTSIHFSPAIPARNPRIIGLSIGS